MQSSDVVIDLNGFALVGAAGSLDGIRIVGSNENINIRNGSIRDWGEFGINGKSADDGSVTDIKAHRNGYGGILYGEGSMIANCTAYGNGYRAPPPPSYNPPNPDNDTDSDGMPDGFEQLIIGFSPNDPIYTFADVWPSYDPILDDPPGTYPSIHWDFDNDGFANGQECMDRTDPTDPNDNSATNSASADVDFDGLDDAWEMRIVTNSTSDPIMALSDVWPWYNPVLDDPPGSHTNTYWDYDGDGYENMQEFIGRSDPLDPDSTPTNSFQEEYSVYTAPPGDLLYDAIQDPEDEPNDDDIRVKGCSTVKDCKARRNRGSGIYVEYASRVENCLGAGNLVDGIHASSYATIRGCTAAKNMKDGITIVSKCRVSENNCGQNGPSRAELHRLATPRGAGIRILGNGNRVENNNLTGNTIGIHVDNMYASQGSGAGGNLIIGNSSVDNWAGAFDLSIGDFMGGQFFQGDIGDPGSTSGSAVMDRNNPFTNFRF